MSAAHWVELGVSAVAVGGAAWLALRAGRPAEAPAVWVHVHPDYPHSGVSLVGDGTPSIFPCIRVKGMTLGEARSLLVGKVFKWELLTRSQRERLTEGQRLLDLTPDAIRSLI